MLYSEIILPPGTDPARIGPLVEAICRDERLGIGLQAALREYPGSVHWHWKRGREQGTLEITHWPQENRLWISVHENRASAWTDEVAARLTARLQIAVGTTFTKEKGP